MTEQELKSRVEAILNAVIASKAWRDEDQSISGYEKRIVYITPVIEDFKTVLREYLKEDKK